MALLITSLRSWSAAWEGLSGSGQSADLVADEIHELAAGA